jgi:hypothetical protein
LKQAFRKKWSKGLTAGLLVMSMVFPVPFAAAGMQAGNTAWAAGLHQEIQVGAWHGMKNQPKAAGEPQSKPVAETMSKDMASGLRANLLTSSAASLPGEGQQDVAESLFFIDEDQQQGRLSGTLEWWMPTDATDIIGYNVYFLNEQNQKLGAPLNRPIEGNALRTMQFDQVKLPQGAVKFGIYAVTDMDEKPTPATLRIWDAPTQALHNVTFTDNDADRGQISGTVTWTKAQDESAIAAYDVYLLGNLYREDQRVLLGEVKKGSASLSLPANTPLPAYGDIIAVVPKDVNGQLGIAGWDITSILDKTPNDLASRPTEVLPVPWITFVDKATSANGVLDGTLYIDWLGQDVPEGTTYSLFLTDWYGTRLKKIGEFSRDVTAVKIPSFTPAANMKYVAVYANLDGYESSDVQVDYLWDRQSQFPRNLSFVDTNPIGGQATGTLTWKGATNETDIVYYSVDLVDKDYFPIRIGGVMKGDTYALPLNLADLEPGVRGIAVTPVTYQDMYAANYVSVPFVDYDAWRSTAPVADKITVSNATGSNDTVKVAGLKAGDTVSLYLDDKDDTPFLKQQVATGKTDATIPAKLLPFGGNLYVTVTSPGKKESERTPKPYSAETTLPPKAAQIHISNNPANQKDKISVDGLLMGDVVKVYSVGGKNVTLLGTSTPVKYGDSVATLNLNQLGTGAAGSLAVSVMGADGQEESAKVNATYAAEQTLALTEKQISVDNKRGDKNDSVTVSNLNAGDLVKIYEAADGQNLLGTGTVGTRQTAVSVTMKSTKPLNATGGTVFVTVKNNGKGESTRTRKEYNQDQPAAPALASITAVNEMGDTLDTVTVSSLQPGDVINVYANNGGNAGDLLGSSDPVQENETSATASVKFPGVLSSDIFVSFVHKNLETETAKYTVSAEKSAPLTNGQASIANGTNTANDSLTVPKLAKGDIVKVYADDKSPTVRATSSAVAQGRTSVTVSLSALNLNPTGGEVYVSVTRFGQKESDRIKVTFVPELTAAPSASYITVFNSMTATDTAKVTGLEAGDIVTVYKTANSGDMLGTGIVAKDATSVTVNLAELSLTSGRVYVTVQKQGRLESSRIEKSYTSAR